MSGKFIITDGNGGEQKAKVSDEGALNVVMHPHPPDAEKVAARPYRSYFKNAAGATDMRVDGSTTNQDFYLESSQTRDIYVKTVSVVIADASATLNKFGNLTALTNGLSFQWETSDLGTVTISDALKSNFDFVRLAKGQPAFGDGAAAFRAGNVIGTSEGYIPAIDLAQIFGLQYGIRLRRGTNDRLSFTVKDNVTGVDEFDAIGFGLEL